MEDFIKLVTQMRAAQREYFRARNYDALQKSKNLEKRVDYWLLNQHQKNLF